MTIKVKDNYLVVDGREYALEKKLIKKLNRTVKGVTQKNPKEDSLWINEGKEGKGKTNSSIIEGAYFKAKTKRDVHLFFRLEPLIDFALSSFKKIIIWDEPALDSLSTDQLNKRNKDMQRFFMTVRKRQHIFIVNYTKFWKFPEYIVVDRANSLLHMSEKKIGRFVYVRMKRLEFLWNEYRTKHKRAYIKASTFGGRMPHFMEREFDNLGFYVNNIKNATLEDYEEQKDISTMSIGKDEKKKDGCKEELRNLKFTIAKLNWKEINSLKAFAKITGIPYRTVLEWGANGGRTPLGV